MDMEDLLPSVGVAICDEPVATFVHSERACDLGNSGKDCTHDGLVVPIDVVESRDVLCGDDEHMLRRGGVDVSESNAEIVFVDLLSRDLARHDLAEKTFGHEYHLRSCGVSRHLLVRQLVLAAVLVPVFLLSACASVTRPKDNDLAAVVKRFHHNLRWKYNKDAAVRVAPDFSADFRDRLEDLKKDLSITSWETRKVKLDSTGKKAEVKVFLKYFLMPSTVVKEIKLDELWELVNGGWFIVQLKGGPFAFPAQEEKGKDHKKDDREEKSSTHPASSGVKELSDDDPDG